MVWGGGKKIEKNTFRNNIKFYELITIIKYLRMEQQAKTQEIDRTTDEFHCEDQVEQVEKVLGAELNETTEPTDPIDPTAMEICTPFGNFEYRAGLRLTQASFVQLSYGYLYRLRNQQVVEGNKWQEFAYPRLQTLFENFCNESGSLISTMLSNPENDETVVRSNFCGYKNFKLPLNIPVYRVNSRATYGNVNVQPLIKTMRQRLNHLSTMQVPKRYLVEKERETFVRLQSVAKQILDKVEPLTNEWKNICTEAAQVAGLPVPSNELNDSETLDTEQTTQTGRSNRSLQSNQSSRSVRKFVVKRGNGRGSDQINQPSQINNEPTIQVRYVEVPVFTQRQPRQPRQPRQGSQSYQAMPQQAMSQQTMPHQAMPHQAMPQQARTWEQQAQVYSPRSYRSRGFPNQANQANQSNQVQQVQRVQPPRTRQQRYQHAQPTQTN